MEDGTALLDAWSKGDANAGKELYRLFADRIARFFSRKVRDDVADLIQRTFLKCLEHKKSGNPVERADALLFAIARNELYDLFKRKQRESRFDPEITSLADLKTSPSARIARRQELALLLEALSRIPLDQQIALELYYFEELPMEAVAGALGVGKSAAISRVHRAREALKGALAELAEGAERIEESFGGFEGWVQAVKSAK